jgi:hypothetical protein
MKAMTHLTRDDVIKAVGAADDVTIAQIIGTGTTAEELAEAQAWLANDEPLINAGKPLPSGRVGELIEILSELEADEDDEKDVGPVVGEA